MFTICSPTAEAFFPPIITGPNRPQVVEPPPVVNPPPPIIIPPPPPPPFEEPPPVVQPPVRPPIVVQPQLVPEPATVVSGLVGLAFVAGWKARRRKPDGDGK